MQPMYSTYCIAWLIEGNLVTLTSQSSKVLWPECGSSSHIILLLAMMKQAVGNVKVALPCGQDTLTQRH
jgi:hypothetical protein